MFLNATAVTDVLLVDVNHEIEVHEGVVVLQDVHVPALSFVIQDRSGDPADEALLLNVFEQLHSLDASIDDRIDDGCRQNVHKKQLHEEVKAEFVEVDVPEMGVALLFQATGSDGTNVVSDSTLGPDSVVENRGHTLDQRVAAASEPRVYQSLG
jgi:hypothetical protein